MTFRLNFWHFVIYKSKQQYTYSTKFPCKEPLGPAATYFLDVTPDTGLEQWSSCPRTEECLTTGESAGSVEEDAAPFALRGDVVISVSESSSSLTTFFPCKVSWNRGRIWVIQKWKPMERWWNRQEQQADPYIPSGFCLLGPQQVSLAVPSLGDYSVVLAQDTDLGEKAKSVDMVAFSPLSQLVPCFSVSLPLWENCKSVKFPSLSPAHFIYQRAKLGTEPPLTGLMNDSIFSGQLCPPIVWLSCPLV